jgi:hypothetical protein
MDSLDVHVRASRELGIGVETWKLLMAMSQARVSSRKLQELERQTEKRADLIRRLG